MLTSHCSQCGAAKAPSEYSAEWCSACAKLRADTSANVIKENEARNEANRKIIEENRSKLEAGAISPHDLPLKPLLDMSSALREAMLQRAHNTNSGRTDPRSVFNPGLVPASMQNLGMATHIPPTVTVQRGAMAPEVPPGSEGI